MIELLALTAALGLTLVATGLPLPRRPTLSDRIDPYLSGLHGKPSSLLHLRNQGVMDALSRRLLGRFIPPTNERLVRRLLAAGDDDDPSAFRVSQLTWAIGAVLAGWTLLVFSATSGLKVDPTSVPIITGLAFAVGFLGRDWWLSQQIERRKGVLEEELPVAIDLITLSIMAGESVSAAFDRVSRFLGSEIGHELKSVLADVQAGESLVTALENLKQRSAVSGIPRFVDALINGLERGSPLADVLNAQADDAREARRRQLLETGGRREVLMLLPVVFFILPVVVAFALLPGLVSLDLLVP